MPVMDGYEATKILRTGAEYSGDLDTSDPALAATSSSSKDTPKPGYVRLRDIPVIAMTASAIQGDKEKCHGAGMDDYLSKPVEKHLLEEKLVKWAVKRRA